MESSTESTAGGSTPPSSVGDSSQSESLTSLVYSPTYFIASVIFAIVLISLLFERGIHFLGRVRGAHCCLNSEMEHVCPSKHTQSEICSNVERHPLEPGNLVSDLSLPS